MPIECECGEYWDTNQSNNHGCNLIGKILYGESIGSSKNKDGMKLKL